MNIMEKGMKETNHQKDLKTLENSFFRKRIKGKLSRFSKSFRFRLLSTSAQENVKKHLKFCQKFEKALSLGWD
ncbi:CLUMA_CG016085, isoform A [Clunio marinus]|uniref:CLUMA_CG016085, isoform A n=1 Tax=Clunio marinus TaxID=568069 RepID=A0A1J1IQT0_9DIPT|nr:CLUMA_CG016085, isoform A [Clunio marinus]